MGDAVLVNRTKIPTCLGLQNSYKQYYKKADPFPTQVSRKQINVLGSVAGWWEEGTLNTLPPHPLLLTQVALDHLMAGLAVMKMLNLYGHQR